MVSAARAGIGAASRRLGAVERLGRWSARIAGACAAALAFNAPCSATLVELNAPALGNPPDESGLTDDSHNLTWDTSTGLEWLDLQFTHAVSYNAVEAGALVQSEGFAHATRDQVASLYESAGLVDGNGDVYTNAVANLANPATLAALGLDAAGFQALFSKVEALVFLLGVSGGSTDDRNNYTIGITGTPDPANPSNYLVAGLWINYSSSGSPQAFEIWIGPNSFSSLASIGPGGASGQVSHFLVRVPEPASATLVALGSVTLGLLRGRRRGGAARRVRRS